MKVSKSFSFYRKLFVDSTARSCLRGRRLSQHPKLPGPPQHGLLAPIQGAALEVRVGGAGEGGLLARDAGGVPPQQDCDRARPRHPALGLERVDGEPLDLGLELLLALEIILAWLRFEKPPRRHVSKETKPDVK